MKIEIVDKHKPELKPGQIWKYGDTLYLAAAHVTSGLGNGDITLIQISNGVVTTCDTTWARARGFGTDRDNFEYVGELKIKP